MSEFELPAAFRDHAAVIDSYVEEDVARWLTSTELARAGAFRSEKRRHEWVSSRIALRRLGLERGVITAPLGLEIDSEARPPLARSGARELFVSFSHSAHAGAAALDERRIGVDLEQVREIEPRLKKFFLNDEETTRAAALEFPAALIHLWAAKEAAFKLVASLTLLKEIELVAWEREDDGLALRFRGGELRGTIRTARLDDRFILALAREE